MTDNEIIKALECCGDKVCKQCPNFSEDIECGEKLIKQAFDLINRLQEENEEYKADKEQYIKDYEMLETKLKYAETNTEFEKQRVLYLQAENEKLLATRWNTSQVEKLQKATRIEAYKEFAERLKNEFYYSFDELIPSIAADKIDNLLKEMGVRMNDNNTITISSNLFLGF